MLESRDHKSPKIVHIVVIRRRGAGRSGGTSSLVVAGRLGAGLGPAIGTAGTYSGTVGAELLRFT
jgi:hypothetical protein